MWSSEVNLWTFAVQTAPSSPRAWSALSRVHRLADQEGLAGLAVERALALKPDRLSTQAARVLNSLWFGHLELGRRQLEGLGEDTLTSDSLRVARRCAIAATAQAARACVRRGAPRGQVLGDTELLRRVSEQLLGPAPLVPRVEPMPAGRARDAGSDAATEPQ
jgi:hypothetical protein